MNRARRVRRYLAQKQPRKGASQLKCASVLPERCCSSSAESNSAVNSAYRCNPRRRRMAKQAVVQILAVFFPARFLAVCGRKVCPHMVEILFAQALKADVKRVFDDNDRGFSHAVAQALRQVVGANHPALVFQHPAPSKSKRQVEFMEYHLHLDAEDVGRVIGKQGRVARAIRTIVYSVRTKAQNVSAL